MLYSKFFINETDCSIIGSLIPAGAVDLWEILPATNTVFYADGKSFDTTDLKFIKDSGGLYPVLSMASAASSIANFKAIVEKLGLDVVQDVDGTVYLYSVTYFNEKLKAANISQATMQVDSIKHLIDFVKNQEYWPEPAPAPEV